MSTTKLLNKDELIPDVFYIFVNQLKFITAHNFQKTGKFSSAAFSSLSDENFLQKFMQGSVRYLPYEPCKMDQLAISPFFLSAINDYRIEYDAEVFREKHAKLLPSRLSALYAFGDYESCQLVNQKYEWDLSTVRKFRLLPNPLNRVAKVNMEHVSLARYAYRATPMEHTDELWLSYWSGEAKCGARVPVPNYKINTIESGTIWEYLIEGIVEHIDHAPPTP
jgi:hypothetical protein